MIDDINDFPLLKDEVLLEIAEGKVYATCPDPTPVWMAREIISLRKLIVDLKVQVILFGSHDHFVGNQDG